MPPLLFPAVATADDHSTSAITVETIQPGISIMRLGAYLEMQMAAHHIPITRQRVDGTTVTVNQSQFWINGIRADIVINATNGAYLSINSPIEKRYPDTFKAEIASMVINNRYQLYLTAKATDLKLRFPRPMYTLCTANHGDAASKQFYGTMLDRTTFNPDDETAELVFYAAGPQSPDDRGGGSWGKTSIAVYDPNCWKSISKDRLTATQNQIIRSVTRQFPELSTIELTPAFLHNGYNMNYESAGGRSDIRLFAEPELNSKSPIWITQFCLKFTHSAFSSMQVIDLLLSSLFARGDIDLGQLKSLQDMNRQFEITGDPLTTSELTLLARAFCSRAGIPDPLAEYMSLPKLP